MLELWRRLRGTWRRDREDRALREEMADHLARLEEDLVAAGLSAEEARFEARRRFGNPASLGEASRAASSFVALEALAQNLRLGLRALARSPGFTAAALLSLTLGIGATTAIFSVADGVLLRPLPYHDPDRLVAVWDRTERQEVPVSYPDYVDVRAESRRLAALAAYKRDSFNLTGTGEPERLEALDVSASLFSTLGVGPALGRGFTDEEDRPDGPAVVILAHELWQRRYGGGREWIGRTIDLDHRPFTVVGVMPRGFAFGGRADVYVPIGVASRRLSARGRDAGVLVVGRMAPGADVAAVRAELEAIQARLVARYPDLLAGRGVAVSGLRERLHGDLRPTLLMLLGAVAILLLVSCANVASLQLERAAARRHEIAIHSALGASRGRLVQQLLVESLLLAVAGGALGVLAAAWSVDLLARFVPDGLAAAARVDGRVLAFAAAVSLATGVLFGLAPALRASRPDLDQVLREHGRGATAGRQRARRALIAGQFALTTMLLVGGGLLGRSFLALRNVDPGFAPDGVLTMQISVGGDGARVAGFLDELRGRAAALPGVSSVAFSNGLPLLGSNQVPWLVEGRPPSGALAALFIGTADLHRALGVELRAGRLFSPADRRDTPRVAIVDEELARRFFPGESPLGRRIRLDLPDQAPAEIVGVVAHVENQGLDGAAPVQPQIYFDLEQVPLARLPATTRRLHVLVRAAGDPLALAAPFRAVVAALDRDQPVYAVRALSAVVAETLAARRFAALLVAIFAAIALVTAAIGSYGLLAYGVAQRRRELGIRLALGAQRRDVARLVIRQGMTVALAGIAVGLAGALAAARAVASLLFEVRPADPATFLTVAAALAAVALLSCAFPARRASRVTPMLALRE